MGLKDNLYGSVAIVSSVWPRSKKRKKDSESAGDGDLSRRKKKKREVDLRIGDFEKTWLGSVSGRAKGTGELTRTVHGEEVEGPMEEKGEVITDETAFEIVDDLAEDLPKDLAEEVAEVEAVAEETTDEIEADIEAGDLHVIRDNEEVKDRDIQLVQKEKKEDTDAVPAEELLELAKTVLYKIKHREEQE